MGLIKYTYRYTGIPGKRVPVIADIPVCLSLLEELRKKPQDHWLVAGFLFLVQIHQQATNIHVMP